MIHLIQNLATAAPFNKQNKVRVLLTFAFFSFLSGWQ
jgi:hypothetical protein